MNPEYAEIIDGLNAIDWRTTEDRLEAVLWKLQERAEYWRRRAEDCREPDRRRVLKNRADAEEFFLDGCLRIAGMDREEIVE